jgi:hypothetical protein
MIVALGHFSEDGPSPSSADYVADFSFEFVSAE